MDDDKTGPSEQFSEDEKKQIAELKARDREVHVHEQAHLSAAGGLARGGANFTYAVGPDGRRYATGGEVSIDTSSVPDDPQATIQKMNTVRKAALAPMNPSATDRSVAAKASATAAKAQGELMQKIGTTKQNGTNDEENMTKYQQQRGFAIYENAI
ncbi:MAG: hypothetical protein H6696_04925 [Deferribacteres bacterium]|nr:hypothetical protein [candidate division KSB1 bacterium]MCB9501259.1 hypothetical protein [Deferribacteres bacterium]